jgi:hypothetical protein
MGLIIKAAPKADLYVDWYDRVLFIGSREQMLTWLHIHDSGTTGFTPEDNLDAADRNGSNDRASTRGYWNDHAGLILTGDPLRLPRPHLARFLRAYQRGGLPAARTWMVPDWLEDSQNTTPPTPGQGGSVWQRIRVWRAARHAAAFTARTRYGQLDDHALQLRERLADTSNHTARYQLVRQLADAEAALAHNARAGWPRRHRRDGRRGQGDVADSMGLACDLLRLVADTEAAIADPARGRLRTHTDLEPVAGPVLNRAAMAGRLDQAVLDDLYVAVMPLVGGTAAEAIACLPVPAAAGGAR